MLRQYYGRLIFNLLARQKKATNFFRCSWKSTSLFNYSYLYLIKFKSMRSAFLAALMIFTLCSCKKKYTCDCVTTENKGRRGFVFITEYKNTSKAYSEKMTKSQAKAACKHEEEAIDSSYENWWTANGTASDTSVTTSTSCNLK